MFQPQWLVTAAGTTTEPALVVTVQSNTGQGDISETWSPEFFCGRLDGTGGMRDKYKHFQEQDRLGQDSILHKPNNKGPFTPVLSVVVATKERLRMHAKLMLLRHFVNCNRLVTSKAWSELRSRFAVFQFERARAAEECFHMCKVRLLHVQVTDTHLSCMFVVNLCVQ